MCVEPLFLALFQCSVGNIKPNLKQYFKLKLKLKLKLNFIKSGPCSISVRRMSSASTS